MINILGISAFYHDSAACLIQDGVITAAAQEERFTRKKQTEAFPIKSIEFCLTQGGITVDQLDYVAFYDKPLLKFGRLFETYLAYAPHGIRSFVKAMPIWMKQKIWTKDTIKKELNYKGKVLFPEHHESHAASAFFPSPFNEAAFLTVDGVGEWVTTSYGVGKGNRIEILADIRFPHSIGMLYSAFTYYTGFKVNSGEYKVMGLAPYGEPRFKEIILKELIDLKDDGSFMLKMEYFDYCAGLTMTNKKFDNLFGGPARKPESTVTQKEMDLAHSVQEAVEEIILHMARHIRQETGQRYLCLAGGVALNCVANGRLMREGIFDDIWIQPAAGDSGGSLGAALLAWHHYLGKERSSDDKTDHMQGAYLGPEYTDSEIEAFLEERSIPYKKLDAKKLTEQVATLLGQEKVIGWFQGRMEFGPRALGARSIIGDARSEKMQETMNLKIKFRESFRPFAPSVLAEKVSDYFDIDRKSPYMLLVAPVKESRCRRTTGSEDELFGIDKLKVVRSDIPSVTHVDYSARVQTVHKETNPAYHALIEKFYELHGCPVLINTSFNVRGEPVVCTPEDAYRCFMRTDMDFLVLGNFLIDKTEQEVLKEDTDWRQEFELD